jgi:two-component system chemotaxis response regulator CheY
MVVWRADCYATSEMKPALPMYRITRRQGDAGVCGDRGHAVTAVASCASDIEKIHDKRFDCLTLDLSLEDGGGTEVLKAITDARFTGSIVVIIGIDLARRSAARLYARSLGIDLHSLPRPIDLAALHIFLANLAETALGTSNGPHMGGIAADGVAAKQRM